MNLKVYIYIYRTYPVGLRWQLAFSTFRWSLPAFVSSSPSPSPHGRSAAIGDNTADKTCCDLWHFRGWDWCPWLWGFVSHHLSKYLLEMKKYPLFCWVMWNIGTSIPSPAFPWDLWRKYRVSWEISRICFSNRCNCMVPWGSWGISLEHIGSDGIEW